MTSTAQYGTGVPRLCSSSWQAASEACQRAVKHLAKDCRALNEAAFRLRKAQQYRQRAILAREVEEFK